MPMALTIDASVVGDVMFIGERTAAARAHLGTAHRMIAPAVLVSEVLSTATKQHRVSGVPEAHARERWEFARTLPIELIDDALFAEDAFELAIRLRHPSGDCLYLAAAISHGAPLVTGDRRLYDRAVAAGLGEHVRWVEDPPTAV
ncbi:MAG: type II toxin-antitoxin system VapC family toxin [Actinobacteria bacterium]|nr:MAG: type II toxin-antitoxin system VapC family toxin [Actinomycetota bacterium]